LLNLALQIALRYLFSFGRQQVAVCKHEAEPEQEIDFDNEDQLTQNKLGEEARNILIRFGIIEIYLKIWNAGVEKTDVFFFTIYINRKPRTCNYD
ncbi:unnamed protein product, partial [Enterobius vermicularis]|uniref:Anoctamin n=1 Tax=Enterobius vermicularis TaxID=51028 RepID=A0A0N4UTS9_ENTVE